MSQRSRCNICRVRRPAMETPLTLNRRSMNSRDGKWARGSDTVVKVKGPSPSPLPRNSNGINCAERVMGGEGGWISNADRYLPFCLSALSSGEVKYSTLEVHLTFI